MSLDDMLTTKLLAIDEHDHNYTPLLEIARAVREQIDWDLLRDRTARSPYATAFITLVEELNIASPARQSATGRSRVTVLESVPDATAGR
jgi:hypothetical protein